MNAAHLRELIELGITGEMLVRVVEIIEEEVSTASVDKSADIRRGPLESTAEQRRKERDKQRKRADRAAEKAAKLSALPSMDMSADSPSMPEEGNKNRSLQEEKKLKKESKKGSRLLIGARPTNEQKLIAIECGCPPDRVDAVWTEFVDYWSDIPGQKGCRLSWTGTWRNRVKYIFERTGNGNGKPKSAVIQAIGDLRREIANFDGPSREPDELRGEAGGTAPRLLSHG